jgi:hypothetical protein
MGETRFRARYCITLTGYAEFQVISRICIAGMIANIALALTFRCR